MDLSIKFKFNINIQAAIRFEKFKLLTGDPVWNAPDGNIQPPEIIQMTHRNDSSKYLNFEKKKEPEYLKLLNDVHFKPNKKLDRMVQLYNIELDPGNYIN